MVLVWDKKEKLGKQGNFDSLWLGSFQIDVIVGSF
jgi:hypothetical protein